MVLIVNNEFLQRRKVAIILIIFSTIMGLSYFFLSFFIGGNMYSIQIMAFIFILIVIFPFLILHVTIPYAIILNKNSIEFRSLLKSKEITKSSFIGYDVDYHNDIRLIISVNGKSKIYHLGIISKDIQENIIKQYKLTRYIFKINPPWGIEQEKEEDIKIGKFHSIRTLQGWALLLTITLVGMMAISALIFLILSIDVINLLVVFPVIFGVIVSLLLLSMMKGWILRDDGSKI